MDLGILYQSSSVGSHSSDLQRVPFREILSSMLYVVCSQVPCTENCATYSSSQLCWLCDDVYLGVITGHKEIIAFKV